MPAEIGLIANKCVFETARFARGHRIDVFDRGLRLAAAGSCVTGNPDHLPRDPTYLPHGSTYDQLRQRGLGFGPVMTEMIIYAELSDQSWGENKRSPKSMGWKAPAPPPRIA
jgi:uncharacterized Fe-S cluster protein YjdI